MPKKHAQSVEEIEKLVKDYLDRNPDEFFTPDELEDLLALKMTTEKKRLRSILKRFCYDVEFDFPYRLGHQFKPTHGYFLCKQLKGIYKQTAKAYGRVFPENGSFKRGIRVFNDYNQGAIDGDLVLIDLKCIYPEPKSYASVLRIIERESISFAGVIYKNKIYPCDHKRIQESFEYKIDNYDDFDIVNVSVDDNKITVNRKIGKLDLTNKDLLTAIENWGIPICFNDESLNELDNCSINNEDFENRIDLRNENVFTIDPENAQDFDDALSVKEEEDKIIVKVHIADVTHFVKAKSSLDKDARNRVESFYTPEGVLPMLPKKLSEDLCSLKPNEDRLTLTCELTFDKDFKFRDYTFYTSIINSKYRLTYNEVDTLLEDKSTPLSQDLILLSTIAQNLRKNREKNGALIFNVESLDIHYDKDQLIFSLENNENSPSHQLVEELMILTNHCAAQFIRSKCNPGQTIYRNLDSPISLKLYDLNFWMASNGNNTIINTKNFKEKFNQFKNRPYCSNMFLRAMERAEYSVNPRNHFALGIFPYTHFTSPIRRYSDIIVHRLIKKKVYDNKIKIPTKTEMVRICNKINTRTQINEKALLKIQRPYHAKMAQMMKEENEDKVYNAVITSVQPYGVFVRLENGVEGLMHESHFDNRHSPYSKINEKREPIEFIEGERVPVRIDSTNEVKVNFKHRDFDFNTIERYWKFKEEEEREWREYRANSYYDFDDYDYF